MPKKESIVVEKAMKLGGLLGAITCVVIGLFIMMTAGAGNMVFVGGDAYNIQIGYTVAICWFLIGIAMAIIGVCGAVLEAKNN